MRGGICEVSTTFPVTQQIPDSQQASRLVLESLWASNMPGLRRVAIEVRRDTVTLRGEVVSFYERQTAVARAGQVAGIARVVDMLTVREQ